MQAIEFQAVADQHMLRLPDQVPDGTKLRVLLLMDDATDEISEEPLSGNKPRHKPSPKLAGSVIMHDDLLAPAAREEDWDALQ